MQRDRQPAFPKQGERGLIEPSKMTVAFAMIPSVPISSAAGNCRPTSTANHSAEISPPTSMHPTSLGHRRERLDRRRRRGEPDRVEGLARVARRRVVRLRRALVPGPEVLPLRSCIRRGIGTGFLQHHHAPQRRVTYPVSSDH